MAQREGVHADDQLVNPLFFGAMRTTEQGLDLMGDLAAGDTSLAFDRSAAFTIGAGAHTSPLQIPAGVLRLGLDIQAYIYDQRYGTVTTDEQLTATENYLGSRPNSGGFELVKLQNDLDGVANSLSPASAKNGMRAAPFIETVVMGAISAADLAVEAVLATRSFTMAEEAAGAGVVGREVETMSGRRFAPAADGSTIDAAEIGSSNRTPISVGAGDLGDARQAPGSRIHTIYTDPSSIETTILGTADYAHEPAQAIRFSKLQGGGEFEFYGKSSPGVEGVFRPAEQPGVEISVSLKSFTDVEKLGSLLKATRRASNAAEAAGIQNGILYGEPTNFTTNQLADFAANGPLSQDIVKNGAFNKIIFRTSDGVVEVTPKGVNAIK